MLQPFLAALRNFKTESPLKDFLIRSFEDGSIDKLLYDSPLTGKDNIRLQILNNSVIKKKADRRKIYSATNKVNATNTVSAPDTDSAPNNGSTENEGPLETKSSNEIADLRPKCLLVRGIKTFPLTDQTAYHISFTDRNTGKKLVNSIFLGSNGVGKSSLFLALELAALHKPTSLLSRDFKTQSDIIRAIVDKDGPITDEELKEWRSAIHIPSLDKHCKFNLNDDFPPLRLYPAYFYAEEDYNVLSKDECSTRYLCTQLGLTPIYDLTSLVADILKTLEDARVESRNIEAINKGAIKKVIQEGKNENDSDAQKKNKKKSAILKIHNNFRATHDISLKICLEKLRENAFRNIEEIHKFLTSFTRTQIKKLYEIAKDIIPTLFKAQLDSRLKEKIEVKLGQNTLNILICHTNTEGNVITKSPREYFNTFRFTLYVVALKISLALTIMKLSNTIFPIVLDDVFDSSDFRNRNGIRRFISTLIEAKQSLKELKDIPLQLILFTQDEVIADAAYKGICDVQGASKVKFSRIFSHTEAIKSPCDSPVIDDMPYTLDGEDLTAISVEAKIS